MDNNGNNGNAPFIDICIVIFTEEPAKDEPVAFSIQKNRTPAVTTQYRTNYDVIFGKQERGQA